MREFILSSTGVSGMTVLGASTLNFINPPAGSSIDISFIRHWVGQVANVNSVMQPIQLVTQVTAFPTLISATPRRVQLADPNASTITGATNGAAGTCGINASSEGAGAKTLWWPDSFNVVNGYLKVNTPEERDVIPSAYTSGVGLWFSVAPATLTGWTWGETFAEIA